MGDEYMGPVQGPDNKKKSDSGWFNGLNDAEYERRQDPSHRREFTGQQYPYQVDYKDRSINRSINRYGMDYRGGGGTSISVNLGDKVRTGESTGKGFHQPWKLSNVGNLRVDSPSSPAEKEAEEFASKYSSPAESVEDYKAKWSAMSSENFGTTAAGRHTTSTSDSSILIQASGATEGTTLNTKQQTKVETALQERGTPLPEAQKNSFEQKLGRTLGEVRIHTGTAAEEAADSINARAFTTGKDIVFGRDQYRPGTKEGEHLFAHEMAHVAQNQGGITRKIQRKAKGDQKETSLSEKLKIADQVYDSIKQSVTYAPEILGEAWEHIKDHWLEVVGVATALILAEAGIAALAAVPEPTMLTKVAAVALQTLMIGILGTFVAMETVSAVKEGMHWWKLAANPNASPKQLIESSKSFCRMIGHISLAVLSAAGIRAKVKGFQIPKIVKRASVNHSKFAEYIFKEGASHGKADVFRNLGYAKKDSGLLVKVFEKQGSAKYKAGNYTLGKADQYGQRITIVIKLKGIGNAQGKIRYVNSGWMIQTDGTIKLNTPFSGYAK